MNGRWAAAPTNQSIAHTQRKTGVKHQQTQGYANQGRPTIATHRPVNTCESESDPITCNKDPPEGSPATPNAMVSRDRPTGEIPARLHGEGA